MTQPGIVVTGREDVIAGLDAVARSAGDLTEPHRRIVGRLVPEIRSRTPVRTGALAISWQGGATSSAATVESPLRYAPRMATAIGEILASPAEIVEEYEEHLAEAGRRAGFGVQRT